MALITNNISGSSAGGWRLGLTGTVAIANPGVNAFPAMPGSDVSFFVSGAIDGKANGSQTVSVFGGDAVVSGSLTVGTGSITITSNEIKFLGGAARIVSGSGGLTFFDSSNVGGKTLTDLAAGGGGGGGGPFTEASNVAAYTTSSIAIGYAGAASARASDLFFYVSGSTDNTKNALFEGNVVTSGSLSVMSNQISGSTGGNITLQSSGDVAIAGDLTVTGNDIKSSTATALTLAGTQVTAQGNLIVKGDLYISGTTTTIDSTVVEIQDPVIGLGFASGSVAGPVGDRGFIGGLSGENSVAMFWDESADGFAVARTNTVPGDAPVAVVDYQTFRVGKLELGGGTNAYVTSSVGSDLTVFSTGDNRVVSTTGVVVLSGSTGKGTSFEIGGVQFAELKDSAANVQFGAVGGKQITLSGSIVSLNTGGSVNVLQNGSRIGQLVGIVGNNFKVQAMDTAGATKVLVLTGSTLDLGAHSGGINLNFADTSRGVFSYSSNNLQFGSTAGVQLTLSGANGAQLIHGTPGLTFIKDFGTPGYLVVEGDGNDARLRATADLVLRADGNDIKFNNGTQTVLTLTTAGNNANFQGASNQQVNIGSVGSGGMTVSGSTITANAGVGGFVFQKDGVTELLVNAAGSTTTISGSAAQSVTLAAGTGATTLSLSGSLVVLSGSGIAMVQNTTKISEIATVDTRTGFFPGADVSFDLGGPSRRWANIYTGDLHLKNERGDYTLIEEEDFLTIRFNKSGKRYKFLLEPVPELDEK